MVRPVLNPGRLLEPVSDCWPRGMTVHDRTRLTGQLPRQKKTPRNVSCAGFFVFRPALHRQVNQQRAQRRLGADRQAVLLAHEGAVAAGQALFLVALAGGGDGTVYRLQISARPINRQRVFFARLQERGRSGAAGGGIAESAPLQGRCAVRLCGAASTMDYAPNAATGRGSVFTREQAGLNGRERHGAAPAKRFISHR